jgi:hypothetical protein
MMTKWIRTNWRRISAAMLVATLGGIGASEVYRMVRGDDCCAPGAACCHPGSPCCKGHGAHH